MSIVTDHRDGPDSFIDAFSASMAGAGIRTSAPIIADGTLHRVHVESDRQGTRNGWYVLFPGELPAGAFGCWRRGVTRKWSHRTIASLSRAERKAIAAHWRAAREAREHEQRALREQARKRARRLWDKAITVDPGHPYLSHKQVQAYGLKQSGDRLIVPVRDDHGDLHGMQYIDMDGSKVFLTGTAKRGHYHSIGRPSGTIVITEGYATGATVHAATGYAVAVAFDCGNLRPAAEALRQKYPDVRLVVAADDDRRIEGNPGIQKATAAAGAVGAWLLVPKFEEGEEGTDWNDYMRLHGTEAVTSAFESALATGQPYAAEAAGAAGATPAESRGNVDPGCHSSAGASEAFLLPPGFRVDERGVWFESPPDDPDAEPDPPVWVCSPLYVTALTRDPIGQSWGRLLEFPDADGVWHAWACPMDMLASDGADFRRCLLRMGLRITPGKARHLLSHYVQMVRTDHRATCVDRTGWHQEAFVLPDRTLGQSKDKVLLQSAGASIHMRQSGQFEGWRDEVAARCVGNSRLVFAVSAAFGAPLVELVGEESGGFHFVGPSSTGKTTILRVGASVYGGPEYLHRWHATINGLEATARLHNDMLLVLDELGQIDARDAGSVAYMLANGTGKHRAQQDGLSRDVARWRLLYLSAGEIGLDVHMREAGKRSRAGQEIRLADIPADACAGHGVFENIHGYANGAALADALILAIQHQHGTAVRAYLERLVEAPRGDLLRRIREMRDEFVRDVLPPGADGQVRRIAARFGLVAAGGELATGWGLTGWPPGEATRQGVVCYRAWLDHRGGPGAQEEEAALAQVRLFLEQHGEARFTNPYAEEERPTANRAGYRRWQDGATEYLVFGEVFRQEICAGRDHRYVAKVLRDRGLLRGDDPSRFTVKRNNLGGALYRILVTDLAS